MCHRYIMITDFSLVVDLELFPMMLLGLLPPQVQILIGGAAVLGVSETSELSLTNSVFFFVFWVGGGAGVWSSSPVCLVVGRGKEKRVIAYTCI